MFGASTAFIFAVIQRLIHARSGDADKFLPRRLEIEGRFARSGAP
jgi:hypothetical protein